MLYFLPNPQNNKLTALNVNETHYAALINAAVLALFLLRWDEEWI